VIEQIDSELPHFRFCVIPSRFGWCWKGSHKCAAIPQVKRSATVAALLAVLGQLLCPAAFGQKPEYEFYYEFRKDFSQRLQEANHFGLTGEQVLERYAAKLKSDGVSDAEIARRTRLIRTVRTALDADYYSRLYLDIDANFNHEPNAFLVEVARGRQPGVALDYGMGQGRNAIYLAGLGWDVWGFDPAEGGIAIAEKRAKDLGLKLHTAAVRDDPMPCSALPPGATVNRASGIPAMGATSFHPSARVSPRFILGETFDT
jgi:hypothetical protein